jgi:outer membrane protein assembly factor BamA
MIARPFTFATRIMHSGRYGPDEDNTRLYPFFLGYQSVVRGYPQDAYQTNTYGCFLGITSCANIGQLLGSKILVANAELRFPLFGVLGAGGGYYGGVPIEMALFADGGVAWTGTETPSFLGGVRKPVYSVGAALRMNLFGYAIIEVDAAHALSRPNSGIVWQFGLTPGF